MKTKNFFLLFLISININSNAEKNNIEQSVIIDKVILDFAALDEWRMPGKYSPINIFDNNVNTCYAEGYSGSGFSISLSLKKEIRLDKVKIAAGYFKNKKLFKANNRVKKIYFSLHQKIRGDEPFIYDENIKFSKTYILKDVMKFQVLKLNKPFSSKYITIGDLSIYKGSKYNDTCISDIQFYYKGKRIPVGNIEKAKKKYIDDIEKRLKKCFSDKNYGWESNNIDLECKKNGAMKLTYDCIEEEGCFSGKKFETLNLNWKVEKAKLYIKEKGKKWNLTKYILADPKKLFAIDNSGTMLKGFFYLVK